MLTELVLRCLRCSRPWLRVTAVRPPLVPDARCPYCGGTNVKTRATVRA